MVATQSFSISRRALDVEDYIDIGRRHAGWIAGPAFVGFVASICVAFLLPNEYTSKATMEITPPQINENMVATTISNSLNERVQQMQTELLSRGSLSAIIQDPHLQLYKKELVTQPLDDVIEMMRNNIRITIKELPGALGRRASAFDIQFSYYDRIKTQQTVQILMDKFGESNQGTQKNDEDQVTGLVGELLSAAKADRQKASDELTKFKLENDGKLPDEANLNFAIINSYTAKIGGVTDQIYHDQQARDQLETQRSIVMGRKSQLDEVEAQNAAANVPGGPAAKKDPKLVEVETTIDGLNFRLTQLRKNYKDSYPEIGNIRKLLQSYQDEKARLEADIQAKAEAEAAKPKDATKPTTDAGMAQARLNIKENLTNIDAQEKRLDDEITHLNKQKETYTQESDELSKKVKESTALESDYQDLRRNQQMAETQYQAYLSKQQMTIAENKLIQRRAGENLNVLDTASLPIAPTNPNRPRIIGLGFGISVVLGFVVAGLREAKDTSLKNLKDVRAYTNLPVLCSIPLLENTMLVKRKRRLSYLAWSAAIIVGGALVGGAVLYYETVIKTV